MKTVILKVANVGETSIFISEIVNWYNIFREQFGNTYQIQTIFLFILQFYF